MKDKYEKIVIYNIKITAEFIKLILVNSLNIYT